MQQTLCEQFSCSKKAVPHSAPEYGYTVKYCFLNMIAASAINKSAGWLTSYRKPSGYR